MARKPHIVIFNPDQWRADAIAHLGNPAVHTPHLDRMAATDSVSFRNAFCQNPICTPSRCSFMTGHYPHTFGHRTLFHMLQPGEPMLLSALKQNGYFVWWGGKNDLVGAQHGFADYCDVKYFPNGALEPFPGSKDQSWRGTPDSDTYYSFYVGKTGRTLGGDPNGAARDYDWGMVQGAIDLVNNRPTEKPLCIYLPLRAPHPAYGVEEPFFSMTDRSKLPPRIPAPSDWSKKPSILKGIWQRQRMQTWKEERWDELRATYYGMCSRVDWMFGQLMNALKEAGIYDDTAVFFFADHGDFTGDYGLVEKTQNTFEDCLTRVPFLVKPPASVPVRPRVSEAMVELIDMPGTVEALTGIDFGYDHFGRSLLPLLAGEADELREAVFCEGGRRRGEQQAMELQSGQTTPEGHYWPRVSWQIEEGPEHSKGIMCRTRDYKYVRRLYESDELYDLRNDPAELNNRIDDPALADVVREMRERLLTHYVETCDVVPRGIDKRE